MANPPPPYDDITGISRTVMKDNAQETIADYNGNARPGEMVVNLLNNDIYIGNTNGGLTLISTASGSGNGVPAGPVGAVQINAGGNLFGGTANLTFVNNTLTAGNVIPAADNVYFLGNATNRWANIWLGPGTLYITDSNVAANTTAELTVLNGVLQINGADQLQVGQLKFIDNTIESTTGNIDIEIGVIGSTADLVLNRNTVVAAGKSLTVNGNAVVTQTSAAFNPQFTDASATTAGATATGNYTLHGSLCYFRVYIDFATCTNFGTGQYQITLPFPSAETMRQAGGTLHQTTGAGSPSLFHIAGITDTAVSTTVHKLYYSGSTTDLAWKYNTPVNGTSIGSHFDISGIYQIA